MQLGMMEDRLAMPDFTSMSLPVLGLIFAAGAAIVWYAGTKLAAYADEIAQRTGIGQAMIGVLLLGAVTSLPEISTSSVATIAGNPGMAVNNLIGSASFQLVVLAICDLLVGRTALTTMVPGPRTILNGAVSVVLLILVAIGVMIGDFELPVAGLGLFPVLIVGTYLLCIWQLNRSGASGGWEPVKQYDGKQKPRDDGREMSNERLGLMTVIAGAAILVGGTAVTLTAEGIAESTGTSTGIIGLTLLAGATSLPEFSTAIAAVKLRRAEMAIGDVLGGNMFNTVLIVLVDAIDGGGPVLRQVDRSSMTAALIAVLLTMLYLIGLVERRNKSFLRMGYDSIAVLLVYAAGVGAIVAGVTAG